MKGFARHREPDLIELDAAVDEAFSAARAKFDAFYAAYTAARPGASGSIACRR